MMYDNLLSIKPVPIEVVTYQGIPLTFLRLDKIHSIVSGNKYFKLKHNLIEAVESGYKQVLTFGGAFSNHIAATAHAASLVGLNSTGIIRGEEIGNPTLAFAKSEGMQLAFIDRATYRNKNEPGYLDSLKNEFEDFYLIPEGGTNALAIKGTKEIIQLIPGNYKTISCCVGTGGTMAGLIEGSSNDQKILGFSVLKGDWIRDEVKQWTEKENWDINIDYHFGGYAKWKQPLIDFINDFRQETNIPLDPVYNGKMVYGVVDLIRKDKLNPNYLMIIHSGGLQGIEGFNQRFGNIIET
ncbi:pyridoxal-phosphate dependent enzyme [Marivirga atlantica]|jgi:1-aminocyclopropane-1-carboxylate deaminase|uniref:1-aminocyclopropane-1-carboxylate deaminase/D-cysteine desulfhydrase n=1 Tax=Marivirga atlantica TaxID=1548457 RepID=A0A937AJJ1_9BACT|nr:1-aminocyclopropane-1-carboxylate deaminase/D-cysteine desulfhydrase [Marivirga atlantica]MBL0763872.1 1-aminocyclopropane-1-carboxylate deaminase/D-cysteine desulfhydrase [Marivirga atlantica]